MRKLDRPRDEALKPIGLAVSAVMAGLGANVAAAEAPAPAPQARPHYVDPTNDPRHGEDPNLILGPSTPVEPFSAPRAAEQADLFEL